MNLHRWAYLTLLTHLTHQLIGFLIEEEKIIADEKIINLLQVNIFLYSWFVKKKNKDKKNLHRERIRFSLTLPLFFLSIFFIPFV